MFDARYRYCAAMLLSALAWAPMGAAQPRAGVDSAAHTAAGPGVAPKQGMFLVATRDMRDPRFRQSVILLAAHGDEGTIGFAVNRPTTVSLAQALPELEALDASDQPLFFGGPVATDRIMFLVKSDKSLEQAEHIMADMYFSGSASLLAQMLSEGKTVQELRVYAGYAGWSAGQLQSELDRGDWHLVAGDVKTVFDADPLRVWSRFIERLDPPGLLVGEPHSVPPVGGQSMRVSRVLPAGADVTGWNLERGM